MRLCQAIGVLVALGGCESASTPTVAEKQPAVLPHEARLQQVELESWGDDGLKTRVSAESARLDRKSGAVRAEKVRIERYDNDELEATATSLRGEGNLETKNGALEGAVRVKDSAGRVLETERAEYRSAEDRVEVPGPLQLTGENYRASGESATILLETEAMSVRGVVTATVRPKQR